MQYDVFNGDADGIFALHQYRLANPQTSAELITGVKRDIKLLARLEQISDSSLAVFDISLDSNREPLKDILNRNNEVVYFDHHFAGDIPSSPKLKTFIDPSAKTCTSLLVNESLREEHILWGIGGAFGDNLFKKGTELSRKQLLSARQTTQLQELGELFNYNGYGASLEDLHYHPADLYKAIKPYANPFDFMEDSPILTTLRTGYNKDLERAMEQVDLKVTGKNRVYRFPGTPWARRISGVFSNLKAREKNDAAHVIITENSDGSLRFSVRAPLTDKRDADTLCNSFPTGGGRAAAAGINSLPEDQLDRFLEQFVLTYP